MSSLFSLFISAALASPAPVEFNAPNLLTAKPEKIEMGTHDGLVLIFLSSSCPCSMSHIEELKKLHAAYKNFRFVGIHSNTNEPPEQSKPYFKSIDLPFPVVQDLKLELADRFRALKTPHVFVFNKQSELVYKGGVTNSRTAGIADKHFLEDALVDLKQGRPVRVTEGRTLGCAIAR